MGAACIDARGHHFQTSLPTPFTSAQRLSELPLPCVTVCQHISTGLYRSLSVQRLSERTVERLVMRGSSIS